jgi:hypothetical protein
VRSLPAHYVAGYAAGLHSMHMAHQKNAYWDGTIAVNYFVINTGGPNISILQADYTTYSSYSVENRFTGYSYSTDSYVTEMLAKMSITASSSYAALEQLALMEDLRNRMLLMVKQALSDQVIEL